MYDGVAETADDDVLVLDDACCHVTSYCCYCYDALIVPLGADAVDDDDMQMCARHCL